MKQKKITISKTLLHKYETHAVHHFDNLNVGDFITVIYKINEGNKEKIQFYDGLIISIKNRSISKTFTLKRTVAGINIEQVFPFNSPKIISIKKRDSVKTRRAKLYFLRLKNTNKLKGKYF